MCYYTGLIAESEYIEFESMVCYAFLTRFPLFDFFFQVIFDLINTGTSFPHSCLYFFEICVRGLVTYDSTILICLLYLYLLFYI